MSGLSLANLQGFLILRQVVPAEQIERANPDWNDLWPGLFGDGMNVADWLAAHFPAADG
jgi:hypothetical protein